MQALERQAQGGGRVEAMTAGDPVALLTEGGEEIDAGEVRGLATQRGAGGADDGACSARLDGHRQVAAVVLQVEADGRPVAGAVDRAGASGVQVQADQGHGALRCVKGERGRQPP